MIVNDGNVNAMMMMMRIGFACRGNSDDRWGGGGASARYAVPLLFALLLVVPGYRSVDTVTGHTSRSRQE